MATGIAPAREPVYRRSNLLFGPIYCTNCLGAYPHKIVHHLRMSGRDFYIVIRCSSCKKRKRVVSLILDIKDDGPARPL